VCTSGTPEADASANDASGPPPSDVGPIAALAADSGIGMEGS
jgi:hypothetical protein